jgi:hypothetical protein
VRTGAPEKEKRGLLDWQASSRREPTAGAAGVQPPEKAQLESEIHMLNRTWDWGAEITVAPSSRIIEMM